MGGGGMGGMGGGPPGVVYGATWYPSRSVSSQGVDLGLVRQNVSVSGPIWSDGGDTLSASLGVRNSHFSTDAILPDTRRAFPSDLWDVNLGLNYTRRFDNGWVGGLMVGVGSPSDKPFQSIDDVNASVAAFLRVPSLRNERDAWLFGLWYSSAGNLRIPIPVLSYSWNPSEEFQMNIGLPLSLTWRPTEDWTVTASYVPLTNVNTRVTYRAADGVFLYGGYENVTNSYLLADRLNKKDRFYEFEQRLVTGVRWDVTRHATLDFNAGYAFGRRYGEGESQTGRLHDVVKAAPGAFLGGSLGWRF